MKKVLMFILGISTLAYAEKNDFVKVKGTSELHIMPDYAIVQIGISEVNLLLDSALHRADSITNIFFQLAKSYEVDSTDIATISYNISREYDYDRKTQEKSYSGMLVKVVYNFRIHKITNVESFVAKAIQIGSNVIDRITFKSSNLDSIRLVTYQEAINNAKANAQAIAIASNQKLGKMLKVTDDLDGNFDISSKLETNLVTTNEYACRSGVFSIIEKDSKPVYIRILPVPIYVSTSVTAIFKLH